MTRIFLVAQTVLISSLFFSPQAIADPENKPLRVEQHDAAYAEKLKHLKPEHNKALPQLFFAGDSISVGYGPALKITLEGKVNALHWRDLPLVFNDFPKFRYAGPISSLSAVTSKVLAFPEYTPKFLMLNSGLHDINRGRKNLDKTLQNYLSTIKKIQLQAEASGCTIIWLTITPVAEEKKLPGTDLKKNLSIDTFNQAAIKLMTEHHVIDLNTYTKKLISEQPEDKVMSKDGVHFTDFGQRCQGEFLANKINAILRPK